MRPVGKYGQRNSVENAQLIFNPFLRELRALRGEITCGFGTDPVVRQK
jgi:hypothetical protein